MDRGRGSHGETVDAVQLQSAALIETNRTPQARCKINKERSSMRLFPTLFLSLTCAYAQIAIQVGGKPVGTRSTLNFTNAAGASASGILQACSDDGSRVNCSSSYNTAFIATHDTVHDNENYCNSTNGANAYTCRLPFKQLGSYQAGMTFLLTVESTCAGSCSLNIDSLGPVNIKQADGSTDPGGAIVAGQPQWIFYDGKVFRLTGAGAAVPSAVRSAAPTDQRGDVIARRVIGAMDSITYAATMNLDVTAGDLHKIRTANTAANATVNATTGGLPGQHMWIIIANDEISPKTVAFGANFRSAGPLAGTAGKAATIQFVSDGTAWYETARVPNL